MDIKDKLATMGVLKSVKDLVDSLSTSLGSAVSRISSLETTITTKANTADVSELSGEVEEISARLDSLSGGVVLYENASGTLSSFTLSDAIENYDYVEVYYGTDIYSNNIFPQASTKVPTDMGGSGGKACTVQMMTMNLSSSSTTVIQFGRRSVDFNGTAATMGNERYINFSSTKGTVGWSQVSAGSGHVMVYRVVGYKN